MRFRSILETIRCTLCQDSMEAGEKVRTLSCDHAFHCGGSARCERDIDQWLLTAEVMACPLCRKSPYPVLPWKQPPPSSPAPSPSALEPALQQLPRTSATPDLDLEKALLLPAHDETLAEASSSASAPPLAQTQLPRTSTPDLAGGVVASGGRRNTTGGVVIAVDTRDQAWMGRC